jgi:hypothetical protein
MDAKVQEKIGVEKSGFYYPFTRCETLVVNLTKAWHFWLNRFNEQGKIRWNPLQAYIKKILNRLW